ncbi:MAG: HipA family kinase, partial [bacterium]
MGLAVPDYGVAEVDRRFADSVSDEAIRSILVRNIGLNFASVVVPGCLTWNPRQKTGSSQLESAVDDVISFDAAIVNGDRKESNPNLLWNGADVVHVIDHGLACPVHRWDDTTIEESPLLPDSEIQEHSCYRYLFGKARPFANL